MTSRRGRRLLLDAETDDSWWNDGTARLTGLLETTLRDLGTLASRRIGLALEDRRLRAEGG